MTHVVRRHFAPAFFLLLSAATAACGDDTTTADASPDGGDAGDPSPAALAATPVLTPCPDGWTESTAGDEITTCLPFGEAGAVDCPPGQMQLPGAAGCEDIGTACPTDGGWAPDLPTGEPVVYVRAGATGGDGSRASPFGSIWDGLSAASGGIVALSVGRYDEAVFIDDGATLWGACVRDTVITTTAALDVPTFLIRGTGGTLRNLTIGEDDRLGVHVIDGVGNLESVEVRNAEGFGLLVSFAELQASRVAIRDIGNEPETGLGRGLQVEYGANVTIDGLVIERVIATGIWIGNEMTRANLTGVSVRDVSAYVDTGRAGRFGRGIEVIEGADVAVERAFVGNVREMGLGADGTAAVLRVRDARIEDVRSRMSDQLGGRSTSSQLGARVELERVSIARSRVSGASLHGPEAYLSLNDVVIDGVDGAQLDGSSSRAVESFEAGELTGSRVAVLDGGGFGLLIGDVGSSATLEDFTVLRLAGNGATGTHGHGVHAQAGAVVDIDRVRVDDVRGFSIVATSQADVTVDDLRADEIAVWACAEGSCTDGASFAHGVGAYTDASLRLTRFDISGAALCGLYVGEGTNADATMGRVRSCEIGACIGEPDFDVSRISADVEYSDNTLNLDSRTLPVPEPGEDLGSI